MQYQIKKSAAAEVSIPEADLSLINAQAQRELTAEEVFVFRCVACDNQVDRDYERFADKALVVLASMLVGRPVLMDHIWSACKQTARIYRADVETAGDGVTNLVICCYMLRNDNTQPVVDAIQGGILREVSVGCAMSKVTCSICGKPSYECGHIAGASYDGEVCVNILDDPTDAYEVSFVAVPSQRAAGVRKSKACSGSGITPADVAAAKAELAIENEKWRYL